MPTFNKEAKKQSFIIKDAVNYWNDLKRFHKSSSYLEVKKAFRRRFPEKEPPVNRTI